MSSKRKIANQTGFGQLDLSLFYLLYFFFFYHNIFFGIFLIIAGAVTIIYALKHPKELTVTIEEKGVNINDSFIEYKNITSFWLDENGKETKLLLLVKNFIPTLALPLVGVSSSQVREALIKKT